MNSLNTSDSVAIVTLLGRKFNLVNEHYFIDSFSSFNYFTSELEQFTQISQIKMISVIIENN